jgi:hypothetical protein
MKLIETEGGSYQIVADGADPQTVRLNCCSSCRVDNCTQMLDGGYAQIALPRDKKDLEAKAERLREVSENAKCLKG